MLQLKDDLKLIPLVRIIIKIILITIALLIIIMTIIYSKME